MKLQLSEQDAAFREEMREFFTTQVPSEIRESVAEGREYTKDQIVRSQQILNAAGLAVPAWPVEWGGRDWSPLRRHIWLEEMRFAHVPIPLSFNTSMIGPVIATFGSQELKERFLPATANLDIWWSQGFSEPDAGSDLASLRTTAVREGDEYVVEGQKTWTTLGQYGDWIFTLVRTDPNAPKRQMGISLLLIDMSSPGVTVRPIELIDGSVEVNEVWFDQVRVPAENLVGEEGKGWTYAKFLLGNERVGVAPVASIKRSLAEAKKVAATAGPGGSSLLENPLVSTRIAELENQLLALELTALRVVANSDEGKPHPASSVLKLNGTELQQAVTELVVDLAGPAALSRGGGTEHLPHWAAHASPRYLNLRKASIYGGSNEIQRTIIAGTILGL
ncbi:acyl-CoA dehydrogenase family protein [Mobilicoccus caccae]|uniref:Acyl-CoA dehydrogenase n=1 Tax=Mobilicoccus caccae TaxID=1859295 RepID=A0ABQ6IS83_9MICO|nr:acyl-CoA dehydrogenase family protein [Mobilicoccus caccae]GMA40339.1 acyl-CoA dehydrogenase [Mobilicoccus caccae]